MNYLEAMLVQRIRESGPITFAEFMEAALYRPPYGYYARRGESSSPSSGSEPRDYFTSPMAHPAFGALLAIQLKETWRRLDAPDEFSVIEMGAGDGMLARDVTAYAPRLDDAFAKALRYVAVDRLPRQEAYYPVVESGRIPSNVTGCVLSNELLDSMPVHRFVIERGRVLEIYVGERSGELCEVARPQSDSAISERLGDLAGDLPDGFRGEVNLGLHTWARQVSDTLRRGYALNIDYGFDRPRLYTPARWRGSLRCYYKHTLGSDPLKRVGRQDMTAHVDFTAVDEALAGVGFSAAGYATQADFLGRLGADKMLSALRKGGLAQHERDANRAGIVELLKPQGMGGFRVSIHHRDAAADPPLAGLNSSDDAQAASEPLPLPLLRDTTGHASLLASRYPNAAWSVTFSNGGRDGK